MSQSRTWSRITLLAAFVFGASAVLASAADNNANQSRNADQADQNAQTQLKKADGQFVKKAAEGGMLEVELGQRAARQASNEAVKSFGQRMVTDHTRLNNQLKQLARENEWRIPMQLDKKHEKTVDKLADKNGDDFDKAYIKTALKNHHQDIDLFEKELKNGDNTALKQFAAGALPILREHLQLAQGIAAKLGVKDENGDRANRQNGANADQTGADNAPQNNRDR